MLLTPIEQPLPQHLQECGYHILETLQGLPLGDQLHLACRTLLAALLTFQPRHPWTGVTQKRSRPSATACRCG